MLRYIEEYDTDRGVLPEARAQVEGTQVKFICIKGLNISPQCTKQAAKERIRFY